MDSDDDRVSPKIKIPVLFSSIGENKKNFINDLKEAVSIPSISKAPEHADDILKMLKFCATKLQDLGATIEVIDGNNEISSDLPPVLFAHLFVDDEFKTICVYGNIDTLSPKKTQNDKHSPFKLFEENGRLYGCGISDNKAPLLCWFNALKIYKLTKTEIPVNIKFVIEGTSESYSQSLFNAIQNKRAFFNNVEYICLTIDKRMNEKPCLKYGYRGLCQFSLLVSCGEKRVHSGTYGGAFNQPLMDAVNVLGALINKQGKIVIPDFLKDMKPMTEIDEKYSKEEPCCIELLKKEAGVEFLNHKEKPSRIVMHKTRLSNLTVNSFRIKSKTADKDDCASIPNKIEAKFSVRLVLNQTVKRSFEQFNRYIEKLWHRFKIVNSYEFRMKIGFDPWQEDPTSDHYKAATAAIKKVYNESPFYICEGSTMPAVSIISKFCPASNIIVMPISGYHDNPHSNSESIAISDYVNGTKLIIAYMCEIHELNYE